jgi:GTPase SAR1 family protein
MIIIGPPGVGKSCLLNRFTKVYVDPLGDTDLFQIAASKLPSVASDSARIVLVSGAADDDSNQPCHM